MKPYNQNIVTFEAMFIGYADAVDRFDEARKTHDPVATYVSLFEALNWAVALDDRANAHLVTGRKEVPYGWRRHIPSAEIMGGVRFARNSVHHQWSDALRLDTRGRQYPRSYPLTYFEWIWSPADQLPPPTKELSPKQEVIYRENRRIYCEHLEGRPARVCLDVLGGVFLTMKELLEPFTIPRGPEGYVPIAELGDDVGITP